VGPALGGLNLRGCTESQSQSQPQSPSAHDSCIFNQRAANYQHAYMYFGFWFSVLSFCSWQFPVDPGRLTLLEVVGFPHIDTDQSHQLELREALARRLGQRQEIPQIGYLRIYEIASHFRGALRRFVGIESAMGQMKTGYG